MEAELRRRAVRVDGYRISVQEAGRRGDPPVMLLHGLASDSTTWQPAITALAKRGHHVLAADLLGHGRSDKPNVEYALDLFVGQVDALMTGLDVPSATVIGHSLGGAIAMGLGHQFPHRVQRLGVVSAGGLGREVHPMLRAASLPGTKTLLGLAVNRRTGAVLGSARLHRRLRVPPETVVNMSRAGRNLSTRAGRAAFVTTLRAVITPRGQIGSMIDASYLTAQIPTLIVWSERDHVIPVHHAHALHEHLPGSRLELFPGASHEPHRRYAERFAEVVSDFVATTGAPD